ncbi:hypothetical protein DCAR_0518623 [Daucus carota subsp. sativus]|uniref:Uncharacterized protein n=2 Tax=Daucus carota subsp. sativus TaxID=79200 RepID=A0A161YIG1_DAUCS|nr:hypothetical protein DCAR_0518623 [Daucus carota subsp. sativus]
MTDPELENITFVKAEPENFRDVVQKLTGSSTDPAVQRISVTLSARPSNGLYHTVEVGQTRPSFMLQERRQATRNLAIQLNQNTTSHGQYAFLPDMKVTDFSPVSTLDMFSPSVPEEHAIANKGFYLQPGPVSTSRKSEPKLLNLFPTSSDS